MLQKGKEIGLRAVRTAMAMAAAVQNEMSSGGTLTKSDRSPVTIADFAAQALICNALGANFPDIRIVGEEDSLAIRKPENREIFVRIVRYLRKYDPALNERLICDLIDMGGGSPDGTFWTLDPIDGTKGFLRGEQFAIALALIQEGEVRLGILGCPNLPPASGGTLFWAIKGQGSWKIPARGGTVTGEWRETCTWSLPLSPTPCSRGRATTCTWTSPFHSCWPNSAGRSR